MTQNQEITDTGALKFLLTILADNFSLISQHSAREYFDLFNSLIALKSENIMLQDEEIFKPAELMRQVIGRINELSKPREEDETLDQEENAKAQRAIESERMLVGLI